MATQEPAWFQRRLAVPMWILSFLVHLLFFVALTATGWRLSQNVPVEERTLDVGVALEPVPQVSEPLPVEPMFDEPSLAEETPVTKFDPPEEVQKERTLEDSEPTKADLPVLATTGNPLKEMARVVPPAVSPPLPGGRSRTEFFKAEAVGASFVFVIDRSASMSHHDSLGLARRELIAALGRLAPESTFQVVVYNTEPSIMSLGGSKLLKASRRHIDQTRSYLERIEPSGGTEHNKAILAALGLEPEVIYFLTDADLMSNDDVKMITAANRKLKRPATIYAIEFGSGPDAVESKPLRRLAAENDGTYAYVDVQFGGAP